jgi:hypothetical protein
MRSHVSLSVLGLALVAGAPGAHAQTLIQQPLVTVPTETIQTTTTVRTVRPSMRVIPHQIVTTRTVTRRIVPVAPAVVAGTVPIAPRPLYDVAAPAPLAGPDDAYAAGPLYDTAAPAPLYDAAAPAPVVGPAPAIAPAVIGAAPIIYRYVYEPDRILVIDPNTGVAVQAIPR